MDAVAVDFGAGRGIWVYFDGSWRRLTSWDPIHIVEWGNKLVADFGAERGIWLFEPFATELSTGSWSRITFWGESQQIVVMGTELFVAFGNLRGCWTYAAGSGWRSASAWDPQVGPGDGTGAVTTVTFDP